MLHVVSILMFLLLFGIYFRSFETSYHSLARKMEFQTVQFISELLVSFNHSSCV